MIFRFGTPLAKPRQRRSSTRFSSKSEKNRQDKINFLFKTAVRLSYDQLDKLKRSNILTKRFCSARSSLGGVNLIRFATLGRDYKPSFHLKSRFFGQEQQKAAQTS